MANFLQKKQHLFLLQGPAGQLEVMTTWPAELKSEQVAVICHPHPLHEGTMNNKVVTTVARVYDTLGVPTVRFNFRGVGNSEGSYGDTIGEIEDCTAIIEWLARSLPSMPVALAGFSFGSYIAAKVANDRDIVSLISIAPSVENFDFSQCQQISAPWLVVQGDQDEVVDPNKAIIWAKQHQPQPTLVVLPQVGHFFHGRLLQLGEIIKDFLTATKSL